MNRSWLSVGVYVALLASMACAAAQESTASPRRQIDFVHIGGNDCPPCVAWRQVELPRIRADAELASLRVHLVTKTIRSPIPYAMFFPSETRHLRDALAEASGGLSGSPHQALLVDGKVVDYWFGTEFGTVEALREALITLKAGSPLPRRTCTRWSAGRTCAQASP